MVDLEKALEKSTEEIVDNLQRVVYAVDQAGSDVVSSAVDENYLLNIRDDLAAIRRHLGA